MDNMTGSINSDSGLEGVVSVEASIEGDISSSGSLTGIVAPTSGSGAVTSVNGKIGDVVLKTSDLENDSGYISQHQSLANYYTKTETNSAISSHHDSTKQDSLPAGSNDRYLHKNATTGDLEWIDIPSDATKENVSNKVTSISASSTDSQYPSAKCLYDICGNIESLLEALL